MKGIILAGGLGKGLRPLSYTCPKQLIPIANKPVLHYVVEDLVKAEIKEIGIVVGYTEERTTAIKDAVGDGSRWGCKIIYIRQDAPRGTAHAVGICREFIAGDTFVAYWGDNMIGGGIVPFIQGFSGTNCDASLLVSEVSDPRKYGIVVLDEKGETVDIEEKPQDPKTNLAITGIFMFTPAIFEVIDSVRLSTRGELEITDAIKRMINSRKYKVLIQKVTGWWSDIGSFEGVLHANSMILGDLRGENLGEVPDDAKIIGHVKIGNGTRILSGSLIKGPTIIGENCIIGPNSHIGSHTSIGDNTIIEGGKIEGSILYNNVKIKSKPWIVDSVIGEFSEITLNNRDAKGLRLIVGSHSEIGVSF